MKTKLLPFVVAIVLAGCGDKPAQTASGTNSSSSGGSLVTAPVDYLGAAAKGEQNAVKTVDTASLNQAVSLFNVDKGRNPKDLNELVAEKYVPKLPPVPYGTKLDYDPVSGKVSVVKQ